jgi:hypothetical protein
MEKVNVSMEIRRLFRLAFYCLLNGVFLGQASANSLMDDWGALPKNRSDGQYKIEHFNAPWPKHIDLGTNGFLMTSMGEFGQHEVFEITPTGECNFVFRDYSKEGAPPVWRQISFKVPKASVDNLILSIERSGVKNLEKSYDNLNLSDGGQAFFSISDGTNLRSVWMNNFFPDEFREIMKQIVQLIKSQHLELNLAPVSSPQAGRDLYRKAFPAGVK